MPRAFPWLGPVAAIVLVWTACTAGAHRPPPTATAGAVPRAEAAQDEAGEENDPEDMRAGALAGTWVAQAPPPLLETQLTPRCHVLMQNIAASRPRLTFSGREVAFYADSLSSVAMVLEQRFPWSRSQTAPDRVAIDHTHYERPAHLWIPCGAMPDELRVAPSGERLTSNVAHCEPCAHEAAIDGLVGLVWLREAAH